MTQTPTRPEGYQRFRGQGYGPTPKQKEALALQRKGLTLREIAEQLGISRRTAQQRVEGGRRWFQEG